MTAAEQMFEPDLGALADLVRFAAVEVDSHDVEPWAELLAELYRSGALDLEGACWAVALYNTYDDLASAWAVLRRWPTPETWVRAPDRADAAYYPLTNERRNLRGGRVLRRLASYADNLEGRGQADWLCSAITTSSPAVNFDRLTLCCRQVWGVGRQAAFEWAEFAGKVLGLPVDAGHGHLAESEGPRRSLQALFGNPAPTRTWLDGRLDDVTELFDRAGLWAPLVDVETLICDFHVMRAGRYYPGKHLAALRFELERAARLWPADGPALTGAWDRVVPDPWRHIHPGIDPGKLAVYRDSGRIISLP